MLYDISRFYFINLYFMKFLTTQGHKDVCLWAFFFLFFSFFSELGTELRALRSTAELNPQPLTTYF